MSSALCVADVGHGALTCRLGAAPSSGAGLSLSFNP